MSQDISDERLERLLALMDANHALSLECQREYLDSGRAEDTRVRLEAERLARPEDVADLNDELSHLFDQEELLAVIQQAGERMTAALKKYKAEELADGEAEIKRLKEELEKYEPEA